MHTKILGEIFKLNNKKLIYLLNVILKLLKERNCPIRDDLEKEYQKIKIEANTEAIRSVLKENPTVLEGMAKLEERKEYVSIK